MIEDILRQLDRLQRQVDGLVKPEVGRWVSFTPTLYQAALTASTVIEGRYHVGQDNLVHVLATLTSTGAGAAGNGVYVLLPAALASAAGTNSSLSLGTFSIFNSDVPIWYAGFAAQHTIVAGLPAIGGIAHNAANSIGIVPSFALANGDIVSVNLKYRLA